MAKRIDFYATRNDWLFLLGELEASQDVCYGLDWQDDPTRSTRWDRAIDIPNFGIATGTDTIKCNHFRVARNESDRIEGMAAELSPGGEFNAQTIISGRVATLYDDPRIQKIMRKLASLTKKHLTRVNGYWVGPDALEKLRAGARLTLNIHASADFNLRE